MSQGWYYRLGGVERGPVAAAELKRLAVAGKLGPADMVRRVRRRLELRFSDN